MSHLKKQNEPSHLKIKIHINLDKIFLLLKRLVQKMGRFVMVLLIFQLLDKPAVVVPENSFVVEAITPHAIFNFECQIDESFISRRYPCLQHIWHI